MVYFWGVCVCVWTEGGEKEEKFSGFGQHSFLLKHTKAPFPWKLIRKALFLFLFSSHI